MQDFKHRFEYLMIIFICISHRLVQTSRTRSGANANKIWTRNLLEARERTNSSVYGLVNENYQEVKIGTGKIASLPYEAYYKNALSFGFTFAVNAIKTIELTEIVTYVGRFNEPKELDYEVYRMYGGFSKDSIDGNEPWNLITSGKQTTNETLNIELLDCVIPQGNVMGIYITLKTKNLLYSSTESNLLTKLGQPYEQNSHISLLTGAAVSAYPLQNQTALIQPRYWRGSINYNVYDAHTLAPSASPSGEPSRVTEAPSFQLFTSMMFPSLSPSAPPSTHESMRPSLHPSSKPSIFIQHLSSNQTFTLLGLVEFMNITNDNDFCLQVNTTLNNFFHNDTDITITSVDTHEETLYTSNYNEITATITAKYSSTHDIDFSYKVQHAITESRQIILDSLSNHSSYFKKVERISSITTPTKFYNYKSKSEKTSISFFGPSLSEMNIKQLIEFENIVTKYLNQCLASSYATTIIVVSKVYEQIFNNQNYPYLVTRLFILGKTTKFDLASAVLLCLQEGNETLPTLLKNSNLPNFQHITSMDVGTEVIGDEVLSDIDNHNVTSKSAVPSFVAYIAVSIGACLLIVFISAYAYFICRKRRHKGEQYGFDKVSYDLNYNESKKTSLMTSSRFSLHDSSRHSLHDSSRHMTHDSGRHSISRQGGSRRIGSETNGENIPNLHQDEFNSPKRCQNIPNMIHCEDDMAQNENENKLFETLQDEINKHSNRQRSRRCSM